MLSRTVYHMTMGNLVDMILTLFLDPVLKAKDITEPASRFVHSLFLDIAKGTAEMFVGDKIPNAKTPSDGLVNAREEHFEVAKKYCTLFEKSQAVGQFMPMRLDEVQRGLELGVFQSVTAQELSHLISAAFDESMKRNTLLNELASR